MIKRVGVIVVRGKEDERVYIEVCDKCLKMNYICKKEKRDGREKNVCTEYNR